MAYQGVLPDYLNDLNAMHEAEKLLTKKQRPFYAGELIDATVAECMEQHAEVFVVAHATAAQRAEAFLKTLNLWTDKA